ncbi:tyrosine-type recombinase/integrase [Streptomyces griseoruber]|uniref:Integrase n=1 Tax=Streptomyces griseoruber TaxID=1943 RepID=A0A101SX64_9ACTN|nr:tyrosine-type recombinase/integrase [Streptomyces griseoruber]KUN81819.1 integrase [Streptomyces griseoruber]
MAKRRPNGGGTITKRKDGRYMGRAYVTDTDGNRVRKTVYGATWDETNEKPLTTKLTPAQLRALMATLRREEVGAATRFEVLRVLRNALNRAMREELLTRNVALLVDMPKVNKDKGTAWSAREAITFLRSTRAHRLYAACVPVLVLGLRRSEVLGLVLKDLKTESSQAVLPIPEFCARVLEERRELQELEQKIAGQHWSQPEGHDLIFSSEHGGMIDPTGFSRSFDRLVKRAGVRRITVRLARHTCGTLLAFLKVRPKVAQAVLRHSQISMTLDVYTHVAHRLTAAVRHWSPSLVSTMGVKRPPDR